jgi:hypothetical protein
MRVYEQWLALGKGFLAQVLTGEDYRRLPRYGELFANDPADTNAMKLNLFVRRQKVYRVFL